LFCSLKFETVQQKALRDTHPPKHDEHARQAAAVFYHFLVITIITMIISCSIT
jgi:hypothetical protein